MFDFEDKVDTAVKMTICAAALAVAAVVAAFFLCLALFFGRNSNMEQSRLRSCSPACSLSLRWLLGLVARKRSQERQHRKLQNAAQWWSDPTVITAALEVFRIIGSKRLITVLLGAFVVGALLERPSNRHPGAEL